MARPKLEITVAVEQAKWRSKWPALKREIPALLKRAAAREELKGLPHGVVSIVLTDDAALRRLNSQFRGKDKPTNVLSFPDSREPLGGIAVAYETVFREANEQKKKFVYHSKHLILHGYLHLLGYDHIVKRDARLMEGIETAILTDLGIPDPYVIERTSA